MVISHGKNPHKPLRKGTQWTLTFYELPGGRGHRAITPGQACFYRGQYPPPPHTHTTCTPPTPAGRVVSTWIQITPATIILEPISSQMRSNYPLTQHPFYPCQRTRTFPSAVVIIKPPWSYCVYNTIFLFIFQSYFEDRPQSPHY